ncbi:26S proteasome non-ATPase regulatory subunit [Lachnellula suecica]|uniref:26S proteasome non-ATPase regulatory subunit n=1 Tax=Lachnellula suecica TaxID=602035 RepID=A0A8T9CF72_9HELO|nr:26S proteasome non-ATPase regulatory subunit [Lachnellula suecica]
MSTMDLQEPSPPEYEAGPSNQPNTTDQLPVYTQDGSLSSNLLQDLPRLLANPDRDRAQDIEVWRGCVARKLDGKLETKRSYEEDVAILWGLYNAIDNGQTDVVEFLMEQNLVTPNTQRNGETPLLRAVSEGKTEVVRTLLDLGADPNAFGTAVSLHALYFPPSAAMRTPLQLAASMGNLVLVKILMEEYHCDDSLVASDGQIALRLASQNGHRENRDVIKRIKKAGQNMGYFLKAIFWETPKFFLWSIPKHLVVKPLMKGCNWCWENRKRFGPWLKHQTFKMPRRIAKAAKWIGRALKKIPNAAYRVCKSCWKFSIETLPRLVKYISLWVWRLLTVKLPEAIGILAKWIYKGIISTMKWFWEVILKTVSLGATVVEAIVTFFRKLTLRDIWNGLVDVFNTIFVAFPKMLYSWISAFGKVSYKVMKALLGEVGEIIWHIAYGVGWLIVYLPRQVWRIMEGVGDSLLKAAHEVKVWVNPKAA